MRLLFAQFATEYLKQYILKPVTLKSLFHAACVRTLSLRLAQPQEPVTRVEVLLSTLQYRIRFSRFTASQRQETSRIRCLLHSRSPTIGKKLAGFMRNVSVHFNARIVLCSAVLEIFNAPPAIPYGNEHRKIHGISREKSPLRPHPRPSIPILPSAPTTPYFRTN